MFLRAYYIHVSSQHFDLFWNGIIPQRKTWYNVLVNNGRFVGAKLLSRTMVTYIQLGFQLIEAETK